MGAKGENGFIEVSPLTVIEYALLLLSTNRLDWHVNNCVPVSEEAENILAGFIKLLESK